MQAVANEMPPGAVVFGQMGPAWHGVEANNGVLAGQAETKSDLITSALVGSQGDGDSEVVVACACTGTSLAEWPVCATKLA